MANISPADFDYIRRLVLDHSAIVLEPGKEYLVEARMLSLIQKEGLTSIEALVNLLRSNPRNGLHEKVVEAMTTNETSFFRDIHPFENLRKVILPDIINKRRPIKGLSIWCGASSSGQEPYSIALILKEHFPELANWQTLFIASDISTKMLDRCRQGKFSQLEVNRGLPAPMLVKYFEKNGNTWCIKPDLKSMIDFRRINLALPFSNLPPMDIIFLRNVLIYFDVETKINILRQVRKILKPDGYLFLGAAESTLNLESSFERMDLHQTGCYKLKGN